MPTSPSSKITEAEVMLGDVARVGSRVKHFGQRYTEWATATVVGFQSIGDPGVENPMGFRDGWIKVLVEPDSDRDVYGLEWDWDRTELAVDLEDRR